MTFPQQLFGLVCTPYYLFETYQYRSPVTSTQVKYSRTRITMTQQYNNNVQMPLFASASGMVSSQPQSSFWGDVDHLDVDILAEYLLDDIGTNSGGVSFDFP